MKWFSSELVAAMIDLVHIKKPVEPSTVQPHELINSPVTGHVHTWGKWKVIKQTYAKRVVDGSTITETNQQRECQECGFVQTDYHRSDGR